MLYQIEVALKPQIPDPIGAGIRQDIIDFGIKTISDVRFASIYVLDAELSPSEVEIIANQILADQTMHQYSFKKPLELFKSIKHSIITVFLKPGVMDPVETSILKAIKDLGFRINAVRTGRKYFLKGNI